MADKGNVHNLVDKWVKDDKMVVTARMLSHATGEHINAAKNHLLAYYRKNASLHPVVAITGKVGNALQMKLVGDVDKVQNERDRYDVEHSIYIHGLSAFKVSDLTLIVNYESEYFSGKSEGGSVKKEKPRAAHTKPVQKEASGRSTSTSKEIPEKKEIKQPKPAAPQPPSKKAPNKRRVIESDDEEDLIISSPADAPPPAQTRTQSTDNKNTKKRKVTKSVTRMNEKGYMVTEDVDEWVSEDEAASSAQPVKKTSSAPKPASKAPPKAKTKGQSSLNSFFMKK